MMHIDLCNWQYCNLISVTSDTINYTIIIIRVNNAAISGKVERLQ